MDQPDSETLSRRAFITKTSVGGICISAGTTMLSGCGDQNHDPSALPNKTSQPSEPNQMVDVEFTINKQKQALKVDTRTTLLDMLREKLDLTGTKKGCDHGQCGACTIIVNGRTLNACLALAALYSGSEITTIEGLANGDELHPVQAAFIKHDAFQCGYCTPGQIMSSVACINSGKAKSAHEIREFMSGNICRCGAYPNIVAAIQEAQKGMTPATAAPEKKA